MSLVGYVMNVNNVFNVFNVQIMADNHSPVISASHYCTLERTTIECSHGTHTHTHTHSHTLTGRFNRWMETLPKSETLG